MSDIKVTSDLQLHPTRRLKQQFDAAPSSSFNKAAIITAPNSLAATEHSSGVAGPSRKHAMGISPHSGIISFLHDGSAQDFQVWEWHEGRYQVDPTKGWIECAESTALSTKNCRPEANCTFKVAAGVPFYIQPKTSAVNNIWISAAPDEANKNNTYA